MRLSIPLHFKLALSYLLVVGLVLLPTVVYLQTSLRNDQREKARVELRAQLVGLTRRLADAPPDALRRRTGLLLTAPPTRLTVIEPDGMVLGDSVVQGVTLPPHADRPEVREAFSRGVGSAVRRSDTTGESMLFVAMRFPSQGTPRGVARLGRPLSVIDGTSDALGRVLRNTAGIALTVAVLLSLLAALVVSRPLHRIALVARAFAEGDFGASADVHSSDEIGEVAQALDILSAQLRTRLVTSGSDRATLYALLDEIPVGVILYDTSLRPVRINGAARRALGLSAHDEIALTAELTTLPLVSTVITQVLDDALTRECELSLPWSPSSTVALRWVAVYEAQGERNLAVIVMDRSADRRAERLEERLSTAAAVMSEMTLALKNGPLAAKTADMALDLRAELTHPLRSPAMLNPITVGALVDTAETTLSPRLTLEEITLDRQVFDTELTLVDADGRAALALALTLRQAVIEGARRLSVGINLEDSALKISVRSRLFIDGPAVGVDALMATLGGSAGHRVDDDRIERWIMVPRA